MPDCGSPTSDPLHADDTGRPVVVAPTVSRIVSLVPSLTESVAVTAPGLLVGATDWCTHPSDLSVHRIGGTKYPRVADVVDLAPDAVLANDEENRPDDLDALRTAGVPVWVTGPRTVPEALASLDRMLRFACRLDRPQWLDVARDAWSQPWDGPRRRAVIPIWRRPWMALGRDTFAGDLLGRVGIVNVLRHGVERYPKVRVEELPPYDVVVLPDEPYPFSRDDGPEGFPGSDWRLVSGRHLTWYGPSLTEARAVLTDQVWRRREAGGPSGNPQS